ncbi:erythromycin esterase family protein [Streptomyces sp. NPDC094147]|uniref:erythromycin esterase family protein n=1 Tax=Streptomyces sp. NPDC094147 TaxID=3366057 RepID=UPI0037F293AD
MDAAEQDALSALLARLLIRFRSVKPLYVSRGDQRRYDIAVRRLEVACHADYSFRAMADLFAGRGLTADPSARDQSMAESLLWHLEHRGADTRVVLAAHNAHILKSPISFNARLTSLPMGQHLHSALGEEHFALALTSTAGHTADSSEPAPLPHRFTRSCPGGGPAAHQVRSADRRVVRHACALCQGARASRCGPFRTYRR